MDSVTYFNEWFSVSPADPGGFWLIPDKSSDPAEWAIMDLPDPVAEITTLRAKLAAAEERLIESGQAVFESQLEVQSEKRRADAAEKEIATWSKRHRLGLMYHGDTVTEVFLVDDETGESVDLDLDSSMVVEVIELLTAKLAEAEDELAASKERIQQLYASHDRKDAKITDLRIKIENAEMLAERRKWGAEEMDRLREDKARLIDLIDEAQKDILVRSHSDVQAAIADVGRRLRAAIDEAKDGE